MAYEDLMSENLQLRARNSELEQEKGHLTKFGE